MTITGKIWVIVDAIVWHTVQIQNKKTKWVMMASPNPEVIKFEGLNDHSGEHMTSKA